MQGSRLRTGIRIAAVLMSASLISCTETEVTERDGLSHYRLTTEFLGERQALSAGLADGVVLGFEGAGIDDRDQEWLLTELGNGFFRIVNRALGEDFSLDVVNDGVFDRVTLATTGDFSGQQWQITPLDNGYCRLTTQFLGPELALDVDADTDPATIALRPGVDFSGQHWQLTQLGMGGPLDSLCQGESAI